MCIVFLCTKTPVALALMFWQHTDHTYSSYEMIWLLLFTSGALPAWVLSSVSQPGMENVNKCCQILFDAAEMKIRHHKYSPDMKLQKVFQFLNFFHWNLPSFTPNGKHETRFSNDIHGMIDFSGKIIKRYPQSSFICVLKPSGSGQIKTSLSIWYIYRAWGDCKSLWFDDKVNVFCILEKINKGQ